MNRRLIFDRLSPDGPSINLRRIFGRLFSDGPSTDLRRIFDMKTFESFLNDYEAGKLVPYLKSEPVPETQGAVKVAVAKNFDELVTQNTKDVLIEFYAPWCGHCKKLAPTYDELGEKMADEEVEIVKMDATANDVPAGFSATAYPADLASLLHSPSMKESNVYDSFS